MARCSGSRWGKQYGLIGLGRRFANETDGNNSELAIAAVVHNSDYANKDFGVDAEQSTASGLEETDLSGGLRSIGINYNYRHHINKNCQIFGEAVYEHYLGNIKDNPITRNDYKAEVGIGFVYVF